MTELPVIDQPRPSPVDWRALREALAAALSTHDVRGDRLHRALYATDASVYQIVPLMVAFPANPADGSLVDLGPLTEPQLEAKCARSDFEGTCYRATRRLAAEHAEEIDRRFPRILRRVGGYNLDEFVPGRRAERDGADPRFNLAR